MIRLVAVVAVVLVGLLAFAVLRDTVRAASARVRKRGRPAKRVRYDWEPVQRRVSRRLKGVQLPTEDRDGILHFLDTRQGVEAYMEPKTAMSRLSVVLVARDGEWKRFELADDGFVRELARTRDLKVIDAARMGYPKRMRNYRRRDDRPE